MHRNTAVETALWSAGERLAGAGRLARHAGRRVAAAARGLGPSRPPGRAATLRTRRLDRDSAAAAVDTVFSGLSERSRYLRFHSPMPRLPVSVLAGLADVGDRRRAAVVAEVREGGSWRPIGIARLVGASERRAELAVAVVDAWQRRGVGKRLMTSLRELATDLGYEELYGDVLPENRAMLELAGRMVPFGSPTYDGEVVRVGIKLGAAAYTLTHEDLIGGLFG